MPKVNQTMLDKLVDAFKGGSQRKPEIIQATTIRDPLGYSMVQRRFGTMAGTLPSMKSEGKMYQQGLNDIFSKRESELQGLQDEAMERVDRLQELYEDDFRVARDRLAEEISDDITALDPADFSVYDATNYEPGRYSLADYWDGEYSLPEYDDLMTEADNAYNEAAGNLMDWQHGGMQSLQRQTPRYRRYQEAMQRRDINHRAGRVNAAIMNLARQGYSLPEIREILRRQGR